MSSDFVPSEFPVPTELAGPGFTLRPLAPEHNAQDYAAWTSSAEHIAATPGFEGRSWPRPMTPEDNLGDLRQHAEDFAQRQGFTYTVMEDTGDVVGCVYLYPSNDPGFDVDARSWVRADRAHLDVALYRLVSQWLADAWPFTTVAY